MERCIDSATQIIRFESYLMREDGPATWMRAALLRARERGVEVRMMIDAFGSEQVRDAFLQPLREAREQFERAYLQQQLLLCNGKVGQLAKRVGMERTHLYRKLRSLGVDFRNITDEAE